MVISVLNYRRNGVYDWIVQRFSALILASYTTVIVGWLVFHSASLTHAQWEAFMGQTWIRVYTLLSILALAGHAWIGLWTIATDYLNQNAIRIGSLSLVIIGLIAYIVWGFSIVWRL